ncbi:hypothetical protein [Lacibacter sp. H407]|uniref:hypothetical protein n=1 Tax=Lacibacter sp. H407 TaxID=3133423 RepID=UPI0030BE3FE0
MLTVANFNQSDLQKIDSIQKSFRLTAVLFLILCVPASFLFGLFGLSKKGFGYWPTTFAFLIIIAIVATVKTIKDYLLYYKDKSNQKKYVGTITVTGKSTKKGDKIIFTDTPELKKLDLIMSEVFDKVAVGDKLTIEISKYSKTLLRLDKDQYDLLNCD